MINNRNDIVFWRIIALLGFLLLLTKIVNEIFFSSFSELFFKVIENELLPHGFHFIINVISCIAFAFLLFKPKTFFLYTLFSFYFAGINAIDGSGFLGNSFLILGIIFSYRSGFLKNKGKIKIYSILIVYMLLFLLNLKIGVSFFIQNITTSIAFFLILFLCYFLLSEEVKKFIQSNQPSRLVLREYPDLLERDKVFLKAVFAGEKFDYIASSNSMAPGTLRNRMSELYKILGVADKTELLIRYNDYSE